MVRNSLGFRYAKACVRRGERRFEGQQKSRDLSILFFYLEHAGRERKSVQCAARVGSSAALLRHGGPQMISSHHVGGVAAS